MKTKDRTGLLRGVPIDTSIAASVAPTVKEWWDKGADYAGPVIGQARDRSVELAAPHIETAANRLAPAIDATRDRLVDDVLPKVAAAAAAAAAAVEARTAMAEAEAVKALTKVERKALAKSAKAGSGKGRKAKAGTDEAKSGPSAAARVFWVLALIGAVAAAVAVVVRRRSESDPWAQPYPTYPPATDSAEASAASPDTAVAPSGDETPSSGS